MRQGFSLVELSIVLVILGLLTGGILAGQSLIRAAELRSVTTDFQRYTTAIRTFRDKYFAIPGDMTNATSFWGVAAGTGADATCGALESTTAATCNGNGDGQVATSNGVWEKLRIWQHLANAGLIEGSYKGAPTAGGLAPTGNYQPASRYKPGGFEAGYIGQFYAVGSGNEIKLGADPGTSTGYNNSILKPSEAWNLDTKLDDGIPSSGKLMALDGADVAGCDTNGVTYTTATSGTYILSNDFAACRIYYFPGF